MLSASMGVSHGAVSRGVVKVSRASPRPAVAYLRYRVPEELLDDPAGERLSESDRASTT